MIIVDKKKIIADLNILFDSAHSVVFIIQQ